jgi:hypothetical protein
LLELDMPWQAETERWVRKIKTAMPASGQVLVIGVPTRASYAQQKLPDLFANPIGRDYIMDGTATRAAGSIVIDHDCFTPDGTEGGPLCDAMTGDAVGMHVARIEVGGRMRGVAIALDWLASDPELVALGVQFA